MMKTGTLFKVAGQPTAVYSCDYFYENGRGEERIRGTGVGFKGIVDCLYSDTKLYIPRKNDP